MKMKQKLNTLPEDVKNLFFTLRSMLLSEKYLSGNLIIYLKITSEEANIIQKYWSEFCEYIKSETFWQVEKLDYKVNGNSQEYRIVVVTHTFDRIKKRICRLCGLK